MITTGDLRYNPETNHYEPIAAGAIQPYQPTAGDPVQPGVPMGVDARASMRAELERLGLPLPQETSSPEKRGGQHELQTATPAGHAELVEEPVVVELSDLGELVDEDDDDEETTTTEVSGE